MGLGGGGSVAGLAVCGDSRSEEPTSDCVVVWLSPVLTRRSPRVRSGSSGELGSETMGRRDIGGGEERDGSVDGGEDGKDDDGGDDADGVDEDEDDEFGSGSMGEARESTDTRRKSPGRPTTRLISVLPG